MLIGSFAAFFNRHKYISVFFSSISFILYYLTLIREREANEFGLRKVLLWKRSICVDLSKGGREDREKKNEDYLKMDNQSYQDKSLTLDSFL